MVLPAFYRRHRELPRTFQYVAHRRFTLRIPEEITRAEASCRIPEEILYDIFHCSTSPGQKRRSLTPVQIRRQSTGWSAGRVTISKVNWCPFLSAHSVTTVPTTRISLPTPRTSLPGVPSTSPCSWPQTRNSPHEKASIGPCPSSNDFAPIVDFESCCDDATRHNAPRAACVTSRSGSSDANLSRAADQARLGVPNLPRASAARQRTGPLASSSALPRANLGAGNRRSFTRN